MCKVETSEEQQSMSLEAPPNSNDPSDSKECLYRGGDNIPTLPQLESKEHQDLAQELDMIVKASQKGGVCDPVTGLIKIPQGHMDIANAFAIAGISGDSSVSSQQLGGDFVAAATGQVAAAAVDVQSIANHLAAEAEEEHSDSKGYNCKFCGKDFSRKDSRKRHERIHTQERPHKCSFCSKTFISKSHQKAHECTHTGVREYECSYCDKAFQRSDKLKRHEKIHLRESTAGVGAARPQIHVYTPPGMPTPPAQRSMQPNLTVNKVVEQSSKTGATSLQLKYTCHYCPKTFPRVDSRKRHERTHTGHKPHRCSYCEHSFVTAYHKMLHERTHTKEKPFRCLICKKEFSRMDSLRRHEKLHM